MLKVKAIPVRVIDGDTIVAKIDLEEEFEMTLTREIRFYGINAPEKRGGTKEQGLASKAYLESRLRDAKSIELEVYKRDSFGRLLAYVYVDGVNLCEEMLQKGYAVPYSR
jgi:micrococcal nuclease